MPLKTDPEAVEIVSETLLPGKPNLTEFSRAHGRAL